MSNYVDIATATNELRRDLADYAKIDGATDRLARIIRNATLLADAYLAEHPADNDEPVTGDWLDSLFGVEEYIEEYICTEQDGNFDEVITWIETIGNVLIPMPKTRGDFRRLCKGLKIELKEPS